MVFITQADTIHMLKTEEFVHFLLRTFNSGGFLVFILWTDQIFLRWNFAGVMLQHSCCRHTISVFYGIFQRKIGGNGNYNKK